MTHLQLLKERAGLAAAGILGCALSAAIPSTANAAPVAQAPYSLTVFARSTSAYSQPDSIVLWRGSVLVGYGNHVAKDGTDGKSSTPSTGSKAFRLVSSPEPHIPLQTLRACSVP